MMTDDLAVVVAVAAAGLGGAAVGVERQWSGHATGPAAHFGGVRTFALLGATAGMAGAIARTGAPTIAVILVAAAAGLVVAAYVAASRRDVEGTTEVAALVVVAAGVLDGLGELRLASGVIAVTCLLLLEKSRVHDLVARIDDVEIRAGARFAVMAVVILPLLPPGPYGPWGAIEPRKLWLFVLLFSGLSFAGYVARRAAGPRRGDVIAGLLGGLVSSTAVTFAFARASRAASASVASLAAGAVAASTIMFARLLVLTAVLHPPLALAAALALLAPCAAGLLVVVAGSRTARQDHASPPLPAHPLQLGAALQTAVVLQVVLLVVAAARRSYGDLGLLVTSALVGLTDTDALTLAATTSVAGGVAPAVGVRAILYGSVSNTVFKLAIALALGAPEFGRRVAIGLVVLVAAALAASVALIAP